MIAALAQVVRSTAEERFEVLGVGFADPWFLAALPVGAWLLWRGRESRRGAAARVPAIGGPEVALATGFLGRAAQALPAVLRIASLVLVVGPRAAARGARAGVAPDGGHRHRAAPRPIELHGAARRSRRAAPLRRRQARRRGLRAAPHDRRGRGAGQHRAARLRGLHGPARALHPRRWRDDAGARGRGDRAREVAGRHGHRRGHGPGHRHAHALGGGLAHRRAAHRRRGQRARPAAHARGGRRGRARDPGVHRVRRPPGDRDAQPDRRDPTPEGRRRGAAGHRRGHGGRVLPRGERGGAPGGLPDHRGAERTPRDEETFAERYDLYPLLLSPALLLYALSVLFGATFARRVP